MNNSKTFGEATDELHKVMDTLIECTDIGDKYNRKTITNVSVVAIVGLFRTLPGYKRLLLPGEAHKDKMIIVYKPSEKCVIVIQSEPCFTELKKFNYILN